MLRNTMQAVFSVLDEDRHGVQYDDLLHLLTRLAGRENEHQVEVQLDPQTLRPSRPHVLTSSHPHVLRPSRPQALRLSHLHILTLTGSAGPTAVPCRVGLGQTILGEL